MIRREDFGQLAYEAYSVSSGGKSLVSGDSLPPWGELHTRIQEAWMAASDEVLANASVSPGNRKLPAKAREEQA